MSEFDQAVQYVLNNEKGLEADPKDTANMGISLAFLKELSNESLRNYGFSATNETINMVDIQQLTPSQAKLIYYSEYWTKAPFAAINKQEIANYIFDTYINMNPAPAIKCVQRAIWATAGQYELINEDGIFGERTLAFINDCGYNIMPALRSERASEYRLIAEKNIDKRKYLNGWLKRAYSK